MKDWAFFEPEVVTFEPHQMLVVGGRAPIEALSIVYPQDPAIGTAG